MKITIEKEINDRLNLLVSSTIESIEFKLENQRIIFSLTLLLGSKQSYHTLSFGKVKGFHFFYSGRTIDIEPDWPYMELSDIWFSKIPQYLTKVSRLDVSDSRINVTNPNVALDIWSSIMFISVGEITIDGDKFDNL